MHCKKHPDREAVAYCQKHGVGFCRECCDCPDGEHCAECVDPQEYCKFRTQCIITEIARERRRAENAAANPGPLR